MTGPTPFLQALEEEAAACQREEIRFREEAAREIARLERARQFAYRRLALLSLMAGEDREDEAEAVAAMLATLRREIGWHGNSEARRPALERLEAVARTLHAELRGVAPSAAAAASMKDFENWYLEQSGVSFLDLAAPHVEELPLVEF